MRLSDTRLLAALRLVDAAWEAKEMVTSQWFDVSRSAFWAISVYFCVRLPFPSRELLQFLLLAQPLYLLTA